MDPHSSPGQLESTGHWLLLRHCLLHSKLSQSSSGQEAGPLPGRICHKIKELMRKYNILKNERFC